MPRHSELSRINGTNISVTKLGLGSAPVAGLFSSVSDHESDLLFARLLESRIGYIDTAPLYGHGVGEIRVGRGIKNNSKDVVISTKVGRLLRNGLNEDFDKWPDSDPMMGIYFDTTPDGIKKSIEESLVRLDREKVEIVLIHDADDWIEHAVDVVYPLLDNLRSQGIINAVGIGMNWCLPAIEIIKKTDLNIALIAGRYTLLDQSAGEELYPLAIERKVSIVAAGVFNSGVLANPVDGAHFDYAPASAEIIARARKIQEFLTERGISLTSAALQFPLSHPAVTTVIIGARSVAELDSNISDFDIDLPSDIWTELRNADLIK